jgi:hypothetical protein
MTAGWGLLSMARINRNIIEAARKRSARVGAAVELEPASWGVR